MLKRLLDAPIGHTFPATEPAQALAPSQRIHLILLCVDSLDRSRSFYEKLGWHISPKSDDGFIRIDMGGYAIGLLSRNDFSSEIFGSPKQQSTPFGGGALAMLVEQPEHVGQVLVQAIEAGATLVKPVTRTPWGINAFFKDPDGHLFEIDFEETWHFDSEHRLLVDE